ncbi:MAG TPA: 3-hydroxyacyl-CoA dehydrogenase NAD-binding domain-containing protein [Promineifilum sp.]|nr:3-hydroxyacyl-CoA dehydrogenase NAD-binding domain-containing protein [Promineifilum sp.]HRO23495.1 3-hydroxyacyl-CoA dehydrogenase NAD-binding domain-containing protein [Promineifilum sp.]HRO91119.1 3-hydroxyacyl-CoA dehydrogenase NAD-binding domain-containing protein [Promineifilum sp.]HRQ12919.1 3-hydroxyacyl-CoA dehydrogenase NAD-binding domain-containing protein [Promineifilum sp.]
MSINSVAVIGSGTMGRGIAHAVALAGHPVILFDLTEGLLEIAIRSIQGAIDEGVRRGKTRPEIAQRAKESLTLTTRLEDTAVVDLVIEAVPEQLELKRDIFGRLDALAPIHTILASNTSSLSISAIAAATQRPERVIGLHFFNPAHLMRLVEIIRGDFTDHATTSTCRAFVETLGKTPVLCKDSPAFIVNRIARPFYGEALRMLGEGVADHENIDRLISSLGFRMGPFELLDLIGIDVNFAVTQSVYNAYFQDPRYRPHPIQQRMVDSGRLGRKSGRGFYSY